MHIILNTQYPLVHIDLTQQIGVPETIELPGRSARNDLSMAVVHPAWANYRCRRRAGDC